MRVPVSTVLLARAESRLGDARTLLDPLPWTDTFRPYAHGRAVAAADSLIAAVRALALLESKR